MRLPQVIACECIYSLEEGGLAETFGFKTDATTERLLKVLADCSLTLQLPWAASDVKSQTILVLCGRGKQLLIVNRYVVLCTLHDVTSL